MYTCIYPNRTPQPHTGLAPTVYATVYLVDAAGEKASANLIEARTEALQSFDPQWHKEVMLDTQQGGGE
jgi:hypothetical protein